MTVKLDVCFRSTHRIAGTPIIAVSVVDEQVHDAGGNVTDSDDEADAVDGDGVPLFMWQALGDLGAPMPIPYQGPMEDHGPMQADEVEP